MELSNKKLYDWKITDMLEVVLNQPDDFLKVRETLTRIGVLHGDKLYQSAHILHKGGRYFIVHFLELFILDGRYSTLTEDDVYRRNTIAKLLQDWGLVTITNPAAIQEKTVDLNNIKVVSFKEKSKYQLVPKYKIGNKSAPRK